MYILSVDIYMCVCIHTHTKKSISLDQGCSTFAPLTFWTG